MDEKELRAQIALGSFQTAKVNADDLVEICKTLLDARLLFLLLSGFSTGSSRKFNSGEPAGSTLGTILRYIIPTKNDLHYSIKRILETNQIHFSFTINPAYIIREPTTTIISLNIYIKDEEVEKWLELLQTYRLVPNPPAGV